MSNASLKRKAKWFLAVWGLTAFGFIVGRIDLYNSIEYSPVGNVGISISMGVAPPYLTCGLELIGTPGLFCGDN